MSDEQTTPMPDSEILAGLKREAICTVAPERMRLYGDAYVRIEQLNAERDAALAEKERLREGLVEMKRQVVEIMAQSGTRVLMPRSVAKSIDAILKEQP